MYRKIPEETRKTAKAMLKAGKWISEVAEALDLSRATIYRIKNDQTDEDVEALAKEIKKEMASRYLVLADTILRGIDDDELNDASLKEKAVAAAIFTDKATQLEKMGMGQTIEPETSPPLKGGYRGAGELIQLPPPNLPPQGGGAIREELEKLGMGNKTSATEHTENTEREKAKNEKDNLSVLSL